MFKFIKDFLKARRRDAVARGVVIAAIRADWRFNLAPGFTWDQNLANRAYSIADALEEQRSVDTKAEMKPSDQAAADAAATKAAEEQAAAEASVDVVTDVAPKAE